jgi:CheY-like chemotaxis protein
VLVIDDDPTALGLLSRSLARGGVHCVTASSGIEGLHLARERAPTLILLDVVMPDLDGWAVLARLKAAPDTAPIPVIMTTICDERIRAQALGAAGYLIKPIERSRLLALIQQHRWESALGPILVVEDDATNREVLSRQLRRRGLPVVEAEDGVAALRLVALARPSLIVLDLMLPVMDGPTLVRELHKIPANRSIPIVVQTAKTLSLADRQQLGASVRKVLQKGACTSDDLLREVSHWCAGRPAAPAGT